MLRSTEERITRATHRLRVTAVCLALTATAFLQQPGRLAPDTKLDLVVDPARFLGRSLHLWEPNGFFGQVQNQAYGYLFPMGPFFALGDLLALPMWVVQRCWWTVLLCAAFVGMLRLAEELRIGQPTGQLLSALAYALAPRVVTVLGAASVEALPLAAAPWVLVPLVRYCRSGGSARRAAAWSGVAVLCTGAVNAAATLAVLPLPAIFLLTRARGREHRALAAWWALAVMLATAWWVVPLLLLGHYSPPFIDYIEGAATTTLTTDLVNVLRGTSHWLAFLGTEQGPVWPAGWELVSRPMLVLDTLLVALVGLLGLVRRDLPHRSWLVPGFLAGVVLVGFGHTGPVEGLGAGAEHELLDGVLAPFRNVHKFDPVLRIPLALGVAHVLGLLAGRLRRTRTASVHRFAVVAAAAGLLAGLAAPAMTGDLVPRGSFLEVPPYWHQAAAWLAGPGGGDRALLVPGSRTGAYLWGAPRDEPLQALARSPWGVRDAVPLAQPGHIRYLDGIEQQLATGRGSPGLAAMLARGGVRYLVVRNDLDAPAAVAARPAMAFSALASTPGVSWVARFGPLVGGDSNPTGDRDQQLDVRRHAVEIFEVDAYRGRVEAFPARDAVTVSGGPESLMALADRGLLGRDRPVVLTGDRPGWWRSLGGTAVAVTDGLRRREANFGRGAGAASAVLEPGDDGVGMGATRDYTAWAERHETAARLVGLAGLRASSSASDANAFGGARPEHSPFAAVDGESGTSWISAGWDGALGAWLELDLGRDRPVGTVRVLVDNRTPGPRVTKIRLTGGDHPVVRPVPPKGPVTVPLPGGSAHRLRIEAARVKDGAFGFSFGIREVTIDGLVPRRPLVTADDLSPADPAPLVALQVDDRRRTGCIQDGGLRRCAYGVARPGEEEAIDRVVRLRRGASYDFAASVVARPGRATANLLRDTAGGIRVTASSSAAPDGVAGGQAVVDRDRATGWVAAPGDRRPTLRVVLPERRRVTGLQLFSAPTLSASRPVSLKVVTPDHEWSGQLTARGFVTFDRPLDTGRFTMSFPRPYLRTTVDPYAGKVSYLPVGVSELRVVGADDLRVSPVDRAVAGGCSEGPRLTVNGRAVRTRVVALRSTVASGAPLEVRPCDEGSFWLSEGEHHIRLAPTALWSPVSVTARPDGLAWGGTEPVPVAIRDWGPEDRRLWVGARSDTTLLAVHENANDGWRAQLAGRSLRSVTLDGWQQGWLVPPGSAGEVRFTYEPDRAYRAALLAGAVGVLALLAAAIVRGWRGRPQPLPPGPPRRWLRLLVAGGGMALVAGVPGLVVTAALGAVAWMLPARRRERFLGAVLVWCLAVVAVWAALRPWGTPRAYVGAETVPLLLTSAGIAAVLLSWAAERRTRSFRRRVGRSTTR